MSEVERVMKGKIKRCTFCGEMDSRVLEKHHVTDEEVIWLCANCHRRFHRQGGKRRKSEGGEEDAIPINMPRCEECGRPAEYVDARGRWFCAHYFKVRH